MNQVDKEIVFEKVTPEIKEQIEKMMLVEFLDMMKKMIYEDYIEEDDLSDSQKEALEMEASRDVDEFAAEIIQRALCQKEYEHTNEEELEM